MTPATGPGVGSQVELVYLTAPGCHACEHGRDVLDELSLAYPLSVREVDLLSEEGRRLITGARVPFPPAVFLGGRLLAHGRLSRRGLSRRLDEHLVVDGRQHGTG